MDRFGSLLGILLCFVWQITTEWMALLAGPWLVSSVCFTAVAVLNYIHTCGRYTYRPDGIVFDFVVRDNRTL